MNNISISSTFKHLTNNIWKVILPCLVYFMCMGTAENNLNIKELILTFRPTKTTSITYNEVFKNFDFHVCTEKFFKRVQLISNMVDLNNFVLRPKRGRIKENLRKPYHGKSSTNCLVFICILVLLFVISVLPNCHHIEYTEVIFYAIVSVNGCFVYYTNEKAEQRKKLGKNRSNERLKIIVSLLTCIYSVIVSTVTTIIFRKIHLVPLITVQFIVCVLVCLWTFYIFQGYLMFNDVTPPTDKAMALNDEKHEYKVVKTKAKVRCRKTHCLPHPMLTKKTENHIDESKNSEEAYTERTSDCTATNSGIHVNVYETSSRNSSVTEFDNCNITFESTVENIPGNHGTLAKTEAYKSEESGNYNLVLCAKIPEEEHILSVESDYGLMLKYELIRLITFKVVKTPVSALKLAKNGFFYTSNVTRCFSCGVTYEEWNLCDNVSDVHSMISPGCEMVLGTEIINKSVNDKTTKEMFRELEISSGLKNKVIHESPMAKYKMTAQPRGIAVIINNELFDGQLEDREGTNKDSEQLTKLLTDLEFKVDSYHNLTAEQMINKARAAAQLDHTNYDCFIFCVLTHGANGVLYGKDEISVEIQQILDLYQSSRCPSLAGKPKMFFIQACQGIKPQAGQTLPTDTINIDQDNSRKETIPNEADILVNFSTVTGCVSFRCPQNGTWFINSLVENLRKYSKYRDIITIITKVNEDVGRKSLQEGSKTHKQIPIFKSTLCKHVYLNS